MKILIYGAGVIGSLYASKLKESGEDVTLLARGRRLEDLREQGIILEDSQTGRITKTVVPMVDRLQPIDTCDLVIVVMRRNQTRSILTALAENKHIPNILFLVNNAAGPQEWVGALGRDRVLIGLPNAGGERHGNVVRFMLIRSFPILFNEIDGKDTPRAKRIIRMFQKAKLPAATQKNIDAYMKTHVALVAPGAGAIYMAGGDIRQLAHMREGLILLVRAVQEGFQAMRKLGVPITPFAMRILEWIPVPILVFILCLLFDTKMAVVAIERHANSAPDEMKELANQFQTLIKESGILAPASNKLYAYVNSHP